MRVDEQKPIIISQSESPDCSPNPNNRKAVSNQNVNSFSPSKVNQSKKGRLHHSTTVAIGSKEINSANVFVS